MTTYDAHWGRLLWGLSLMVVGILVVVVPASMWPVLQLGGAAGWAAALGGAGGLGVLVAGWLFRVTGYTVERDVLRIHRPIGDYVLPLDGLQGAVHDPQLIRGALRTFGNGGLFAFSGLYYNRSLGRFRCWVTDFDDAVVLRFVDRTVVVSPSDPEGFVAAVGSEG